jgi:uncharacterized protein YqiB (DUF1249 family)
MAVLHLVHHAHTRAHAASFEQSQNAPRSESVEAAVNTGVATYGLTDGMRYTVRFPIKYSVNTDSIWPAMSVHVLRLHTRDAAEVGTNELVAELHEKRHRPRVETVPVSQIHNCTKITGAHGRGGGGRRQYSR